MPKCYVRSLTSRWLSPLVKALTILAFNLLLSTFNFRLATYARHEVSASYFRPTEVETLLCTPSKAKDHDE